MNLSIKILSVFAIVFIFALDETLQAAVPPLPEKDGSVTIAAQEWPFKPGPRTVKVYLHYPGGKLENVNSKTGLMLSLHNWGGTACAGTANPNQLANRLNVVAICLDYLQSGRQASVEDPEPYDFGYLQGLDALRALHFVFDGLKSSARPFHSGRIFATGGSGGGNVTLMVNKLAPRTFTCSIDMCGMARLTDDVAFNLPGGSRLNARWSNDPKHAYYLSPDRQALHHIGNPAHLKVMHTLNPKRKLIVVHGSTDTTCPFEDATEMVANMKTAGMDVEPYFLTDKILDGKVFTNTGHGLGNRTLIVFKVAGKYLSPDSPDALIRKTPTDFELKDRKVRYPTKNGAYVISYEHGYPVGLFESRKSP